MCLIEGKKFQGLVIRSADCISAKGLMLSECCARRTAQQSTMPGTSSVILRPVNYGLLVCL
jgi:hypothetical protein